MEDLDIYRRIIIKWVFKKCDAGMDWIDPLPDRDRLVGRSSSKIS